MGTSFDQWRIRFVNDLKRDKRKSAIMGVLVVAALFFGVRALLDTTSPASASASAKGGRKSLAIGGGMSDEASLRRQAARQSHLQSLDMDIRRDLFGADLRAYPQQKTTEVVKVLPTVASAPADDKAEALRRRVRAEAATLTLESVLSGQQPMACINGKVLQSGQRFNGFEVQRITSRGCVLEKEGVQVELVLKKQ